ncbi:MAG TPA: hypothetical protein VJZ71_06270 [Phycisphaerae bacterium]|nr:hypothetical protein [Phycisphaerae bacterium]
MRIAKLPYSIGGQFITAMLGGIMILGGPGCQSVQFGGDGQDSVDLSNPTGFLINTDAAAKVLGGLRLVDGKSAFAYGTFKDDGTIETLDAAVLRDAEGKEASAVFGQFSGKTLLKSATSFDGSRVDISYDTVTDTRLAGQIHMHFAGLEDTHTIAFDVDLLEALAELARKIEELTGIQISTNPLPDDPETGKLIQSALDSGALDKYGANSPVALSLFVFSFQYGFASVGFFMVKLMGRIMEAMIHFYVDLVVAATKVMIIAFCTPFIIMGEIMRAAFDHPVFVFNFTLLNPDIVIIPGRPDDD